MSARKIEIIKSHIAFIQDYLPEIDTSSADGFAEYFKMLSKLHQLKAQLA